MTKLKPYLSIVFAIALLLGVYPNAATVQAADESVSVFLERYSSIDAALAVGPSDVNINTFEEDLAAKLNALGVPRDRVKVTAVETTEVSVEDAFAWNIYDHQTTQWAYTTNQSYWEPTNPNKIEPPAGSTSGPYNHIWTYDQGKKIVFYGYETNAYRDFMYMPDNSPTKKTFTFTMDDANINNHSMQGGGFLFNVNISGDAYAPATNVANLGSIVDSTVLANQRISGYMLLLEKQYDGSSRPALYKIDNKTLTEFHNSGAGLTQVPLTTNGDPMSGVHDIKIEVSGSSFKLWDTVNGVTSVSVYEGIEDFGSYGFGPIAQYTSHSCTLLSWFNFENLQMETTKTRKFMEVLREPVWTDGSAKFVINLDDSSSGDPSSPVADFSDPEKLGEIVSRMNGESMHYIGWGLDDNADPAVDDTAEQAQAFIAKNDNRGAFVNRDGTTYDEQLNAIAQYIAGEYNKTIVTDTSKIPAGSGHQLKSSPESAGTNADGKWKISHTPSVTAATYFPYHDIPMDELDVKLTLPGTYNVYYDGELVKTVEVYSQPTTHFTTVLTPNGGQYDVTLTNRSYDPYDLQRDVVTGATEQWRYKETTASDWTMGKPTSLDADKDYVIELSILDENGEWTKPYTQYVSTKATPPAPIADFDLSTDVLNLNQQTTVNLKDLSYDPTGAPLSNTTVTVTKSGKPVAVPYNSTTGELDFSGFGPGNYKITVEPENSIGAKSAAPFTRVLTVNNDTSAPTVTVSKTSGGIIVPHDITLSFSDTGNSGLAYQQISVSTSTYAPSGDQWGGASKKTSRTITFTQLGDYYIHYRAVDMAGNELIGYYGPYQSYSNENTYYAPANQNVNFSVTDFVYKYPEGNSTLASVIITQLPANGKLLLNGTELSVTSSIYRDDLNQLVFVPDPNWNGITNFKWQGTDGTNTTAEIEVVLVVNTPPAPVSNTKTGTPLDPIGFDLSDFTLNDVDQDTVSKIKITSLPNNGTLKLRDVDVTVNQEINAADIPFLTFVPETGWFGTATFTWNGHDGISYAATDSVMTISIWFPSTPEPVTEELKVDVNAGIGGTVTQATIKRTTDINGTVTDRVTFSAENAIEAADKLDAQGQTTARIVIPDAGDRVSETNVTIPRAALDVLGGKAKDLEIYTANGSIVIPAGSLRSMREDLYFRIVPIKSDSEKEIVIQRVQKEELVKQIVKDDTVRILGRPMIIETNMKSQPVIITLPLYDRLPSDEKERTHILNNLVIFIEHDDGTKDLVKPELTTYASTNDLGVQFGIDKFSIFTMVYMEGWEAYLAALEAGKAIGEHGAYVTGYPDGTFKPNKQLTRAEVAALLARTLIASTDAGGELNFSDLKNTHWAYAHIQKAVRSGLMEGYPDGKFQPNRIVTRAEMAAIVYRLRGLTELQPSSFSDTAMHWADGMIGAVQASGLVNGYVDGTYKPNQGLTRAEAVQLFNKLLDRGPLKGVTEAIWPDVPNTHWAFEDIAEASKDHGYTLKDKDEYWVEEAQ